MLCDERDAQLWRALHEGFARVIRPLLRLLDRRSATGLPDEIAAALDMPIGSIRTDLRARALAQLRRELQREGALDEADTFAVALG